MSAISNNLENQLLNALLDQAAYPTHSTVWIALFGTGYNLESNSFGAEITGSGYARQIANFGTANGGEITNTQTITFDVNSAWETIEAIAIVTGAGGVQGNGDILFWTTINSLNAQNNLDLVINPGELKVRLN
tara:strand:+ start:1222 stop:1620 length:399 start_codon:yes stop_codon:yes gene_type:complete